MEPNADQLEFIDSKTNLASNPARYEVDVPEVAKPKPVVVIGPNAVYLNVPGHWDQKVGEVEPPEPPVTEPPPVEEAGPPVLSSLEPAQLSVEAPDTTVLLKGTGFTEESVIVWNGGEEVTNFGDPTTLSTLVKPSTVDPGVPLPFSLPVLVRTGAQETTPLDFTFVS
jgi:hypothetical protein